MLASTGLMVEEAVLNCYTMGWMRLSTTPCMEWMERLLKKSLSRVGNSNAIGKDSVSSMRVFRTALNSPMVDLEAGNMVELVRREFPMTLTKKASKLFPIPHREWYPSKDAHMKNLALVKFSR
jgi:hypothetical protein